MDEKNHTDWETKGIIFRYEFKNGDPLPLTPHPPLHLKFRNMISKITLRLGANFLS